MPFVLIKLFNQDVLEEYFGRHRSTERKHDNPDLYNFDYNSNTIRMQQSIAPVTGKTRGVISRNVAFLGFQLTMHFVQYDFKTNDLC